MTQFIAFANEQPSAETPKMLLWRRITFNRLPCGSLWVQQKLATLGNTLRWQPCACTKVAHEVLPVEHGKIPRGMNSQRRRGTPLVSNLNMLAFFRRVDSVTVISVIL